MRSLMPLLVPDVVVPGDYIIREGEIGKEMYLLRSGILEVVSHGKVVAELSDGSYVGEVAIIFEQKRCDSNASLHTPRATLSAGPARANRVLAFSLLCVVWCGAGGRAARPLFVPRRSAT